MGILNIDEHVEEHRLMAIRYPNKAVAQILVESVTYDASGRVSARDGWAISYDSQGRVASQTNGVQTYTFSYDSAGRYTGYTVTP